MRFIRLISAIALAFFSSFLIATSANAHADVVSTSPVDGSDVDVAPAQISITFSEPVLEVGTAIVLNQADGTEIPVGPLMLDGSTISVAPPADLAAGEYKVTWRASADDGHVLTGEFGFTFNGTIIAVNDDVSASPMAQTGIEPTDTTQTNSNAWIILLASFVASATIGTIYATKKRK